MICRIDLLKGGLFAELNNGKKDVEIQPGFEPRSSELWSDALTNRATGALATVSMDKCHLSSAPVPELQWLSW